MLAAPLAAHAHGAGPAPGWTWDPWIVGPLALSAALYAIGSWRIARRSRTRGKALDRRRWLFWSGWLVLAGALISPLHQAGERSFAFHMGEHELLMLIAPPLLVLSRPVAALLWGLPDPLRRVGGVLGAQGWYRGVWRFISGPVVATLLQAAALWLWHAPALFNLSLASDGWHAAQHLSFLVTALLFWSAVLEGEGRRRPGLAAACLFATSLIGGLLGALMALSSSPWYQPYAALGLDAFGMSPTEDQQLAGLLMWIPGGVIHAGAGLAILAKGLGLFGPSAGPVRS